MIAQSDTSCHFHRSQPSGLRPTSAGFLLRGLLVEYVRSVEEGDPGVEGTVDIRRHSSSSGFPLARTSGAECNLARPTSAGPKLALGHDHLTTTPAYVATAMATHPATRPEPPWGVDQRVAEATSSLMSRPRSNRSCRTPWSRTRESVQAMMTVPPSATTS